MSDEDKLQGELKRGGDAAFLLEHPLFLEAHDRIRKQVLQEWEQAPARDTEGRERLWLMLKLLSRLVAHIEGVANTGKLAKSQLAEIAEKRKLGFW